MNFEYFISGKIVKNKGKSFSRLIVIIARIAIALSLAVMIVSTSMVNGFRETISEKIYGFWGHINISKESLRSSYNDLPITKKDEFIGQIKDIPGVAHVQVYARKAGIIKTKTDIEGIILKGISNDFFWQHFSQYIINGKGLELNDTTVSKGILLSKSIADRMRFNVGDSVILHFIDMSESGDYLQRYRKLRVEGIYNTGLEEFDKLFALIDIRHIQKLNNWSEEQIGGYEVFVDNPKKISSIEEQVSTAADPFWSVQSIYDVIPTIFDWLNLQKVNERIILLLMLIVAIINMITSLLILILERTNMIGILKALGSSNRSIQNIFLMNAAYIILWGMFWGNILGLGICYVQKYFEIIKLPEQSYYVSEAPVSINYVWILALNLITLSVCVICLLIPSGFVARIKPVKAIQFH